MRRGLPIALLVTLSPALFAAEKRSLSVDDLFALKTVGDPRLAPDGQWVAYTVTTLDAQEDASDTDIYMAPVGGGEAVRLTASKKPETSPRFSPDGRYLAFLSAREGKKTQVWLLPRRGGEAVKLTDYKASVSSLTWSPDSTRVALVVSDVNADDPEDEKDAGSDKKAKTPKPIVIRRLQFKRDGEGYLRELRRHLYVFDVQNKASVQVTSGPYDDSEPAWSPDGQWIVFASNRTPEPDENQNTDLFVVAAKADQTPRPLTTAATTDRAPVVSPDGRFVAYLEGGDPKDIWYATDHVAIVPFAGGASRALTQALDRNVGSPRFTPDGRFLLFLLEDGGNRHLARVPVAGGPVERVVAGEREILQFDVGGKGEIVVLESQPEQPPEISTATAAGLKRITTVNDAVLKDIRLSAVERFKAKSADGTMIDGFLTRPPDAKAGARLPAVLRIHGGPVSQYSTRFNFEWQVLAAQGYAVVAANPRGSSGYGRDFSYAIWADWGHRDFQDLMAAVDHMVAKGAADPERLGVGGWSYGGMMTDYVIAQTGRFRAAIAGAGSGNYMGNYGPDHYQRQYEAELGLPWRTREVWLKLSSPFFQADKITTPTLFMCGERDVNVPTINSEQMYQALRRLGIETELVIYPGEPHGISKPSYQKDRYQRYIAWYDKHLKPAAASGS